jgi:hypothetical protein
MDEEKTPGQVGYEAYAKKAGWYSLITSSPLPEWAAVDQDVKDAWEAAAAAVLAADAESRKAENVPPR